MSLISKASREELEVLALHREAALTGVRRRGEEDNVAVGEIAASGERLDDAALAGKRRVRGRVREGEGDGVADFEGDGAFLARGCGIVDRGSRRLASRGGRRLGDVKTLIPARRILLECRACSGDAARTNLERPRLEDVTEVKLGYVYVIVIVYVTYTLPTVHIPQWTTSLIYNNSNC